MPDPILDPEFWRKRLAESPPGQMHHAVFRCPLDRWREIEAKHREILARHVGLSDSVLDCGCGWGRLLELLPPGWHGQYLGLDLSPDFIGLARARHPGKAFAVCRLEGASREVGIWPYGWAVLISIRPMIRRNLGDEVWGQMEAEIRRCARRLLYLEYDPADEGSIE